MTDSSQPTFLDHVRRVVADAVSASEVSVESVERHGSGSSGVLQVSVARRVLPEHLSTETSTPLPGLTLDDLAEVTPIITTALESVDPDVLTTTSLEVTSPGLSAPLRTPEQFRRHVTRLVTFALREGAPLTGRIVGVTHDHVRVHVDGADARELPFDQIEHGTVQVEFSRPKDQE